MRSLRKLLILIMRENYFQGQSIQWIVCLILKVYSLIRIFFQRPCCCGLRMRALLSYRLVTAKITDFHSLKKIIRLEDKHSVVIQVTRHSDKRAPSNGAFYPKYRLGHPVKLVFFHYVQTLFWIKVSKNCFIYFENRSTGAQHGGSVTSE